MCVGNSWVQLGHGGEERELRCGTKLLNKRGSGGVLGRIFNRNGAAEMQLLRLDFLLVFDPARLAFALVAGGLLTY
jgi:hypothetical protein